MKFTEMYEYVLGYWPKEIELNDCLGKGEFWHSAKLTSTFKSVDEKIGVGWTGSVNFAIYRVIRELLPEICLSENKRLALNDICATEVEKWVRTDFESDAGWSDVLAEYENDLNEGTCGKDDGVKTR